MMKTMIALAVVAGTAGPALTQVAQTADAPAYAEGQILVSCFRGPWKGVIWDRPNTEFVESLVQIGYDYATASAIAERICRDDTLVDNPEGLRETMLRIDREVR